MLRGERFLKNAGAWLFMPSRVKPTRSIGWHCMGLPLGKRVLMHPVKAV
jgi:hypothetical protein